MKRWQLFQGVGVQNLAAIGPVRIVPVEIATHPVVHADVEVGQHDDRSLHALGQVESLHGHIETFLGIRREQQNVAGITVRRIGTSHDVGLLGARGHTGGRAAALYVDDHGRNLGEIAISQKFAHQRNPGTAGRGKRPGAVPAGAQHHTDCGQFVLGLQDREITLPGFRVAAVLLGEILERIHD